jgi:hypothetical protein
VWPNTDELNRQVPLPAPAEAHITRSPRKVKGENVTWDLLGAVDNVAVAVKWEAEAGFDGDKVDLSSCYSKFNVVIDYSTGILGIEATFANAHEVGGSDSVVLVDPASLQPLTPSYPEIIGLGETYIAYRSEYGIVTYCDPQTVPPDINFLLDKESRMSTGTSGWCVEVADDQGAVDSLLSEFSEDYAKQNLTKPFPLGFEGPKLAKYMASGYTNPNAHTSETTETPRPTLGATFLEPAVRKAPAEPPLIEGVEPVHHLRAGKKLHRKAQQIVNGYEKVDRRAKDALRSPYTQSVRLPGVWLETDDLSVIEGDGIVAMTVTADDRAKKQVIIERIERNGRPLPDSGIHMVTDDDGHVVLNAVNRDVDSLPGTEKYADLLNDTEALLGMYGTALGHRSNVRQRPRRMVLPITALDVDASDMGMMDELPGLVVKKSTPKEIIDQEVALSVAKFRYHRGPR